MPGSRVANHQWEDCDKVPKQVEIRVMYAYLSSLIDFGPVDCEKTVKDDRRKDQEPFKGRDSRGGAG